MATAAVVLLLCIGSCRGVRVVSIGDSFTEGWIPTTEQKAPPSEYAQQCLDYRLGGSQNLVLNQGIGWGSVVDKDYNITQHVVDVVIPGAGKKGYDWAVVWTGGVNDFFNSNYKGSVQGVFDATKALWDLLMKQGWRVLVIPQVALITMANTSTAETRRREFVAIAKSYISKADDPNLQYVDLEVLGLDGWNMSREERALYFDKIHLSKAGYDRVGQVLCDFFTAWARKQPLDTIVYTPLTSNYTQLPKSHPLNSTASVTNTSDTGDSVTNATGAITPSTNDASVKDAAGDTAGTAAGTGDQDADASSKSSDKARVISPQSGGISSQSSNSNTTEAANAATPSTTTAAKSGSMASAAVRCVLLAACVVVVAAVL